LVSVVFTPRNFFARYLYMAMVLSGRLSREAYGTNLSLNIPGFSLWDSFLEQNNRGVRLISSSPP